MDEKDAPSEDTPVLKGSDIKLDSISDSQESLRNDNLHDMEPLSYLNLILLNITWFGTNLMYLVLCVVVVPAQIHAMVGEAAKGRWLGGIVACEPIDLVEKRCSPYSNQTYPVVSLEAPKIENADQSAASGLVSDPEVSLATTFGEVKTGNIGSTSGMMGFMILLGNISGAVIGIFFGTIGVLGIYIFVSSVLVVTVLITVITTTEELGKTTHEPLKPWCATILNHSDKEISVGYSLHDF
uniref:Uncharacterized protein LOC102805483 n=1 Tax=Saccoglossus kowalevskii TaxID=10224 RepID=A0ABM0MNW5_SACKO|nr:PREDICTED: uncharacterized protein LOC102805483 [Saccoglossus kowalevskii]